MAVTGIFLDKKRLFFDFLLAKWSKVCYYIYGNIDFHFDLEKR